jgi:hypothetical protein
MREETPMRRVRHEHEHEAAWVLRGGPGMYSRWAGPDLAGPTYQGGKLAWRLALLAWEEERPLASTGDSDSLFLFFVPARAPSISMT